MQTAGSNGIMERAPGQQSDSMFVGAEATNRAYGEANPTRRGANGGRRGANREQEEGEEGEPSADEYGAEQYVEDVTDLSE
jgi:hypothetical protein